MSAPFVIFLIATTLSASVMLFGDDAIDSNNTPLQNLQNERDLQLQQDRQAELNREQLNRDELNRAQNQAENNRLEAERQERLRQERARYDRMQQTSLSDKDESVDDVDDFSDGGGITTPQSDGSE